MIRILIYLLCLVTFALTGCTGEEVGRIPVNAVSTDSLNTVIKESAPISLKKGDKLYAWAVMDMEYEGELQLQFSIEMIRDGNSLGVVEMNPMENDVKMNAVETAFGNKTTASYSGRMNYINIPEGGNYVFRALLSSNDNPTLKLNKAELVFKK